MSNLTCLGFNTCTNSNGEYRLDIKEINYFFTECTSLKVESCEDFDQNKIKQSIKHLSFVYEHDGKQVKEPIKANLVFDKKSRSICYRHGNNIFKSCVCHEYSFTCNISRPKRLTINKKDPQQSIKNISIVFNSNFDLRVQFLVSSSHIDNHKK